MSLPLPTLEISEGTNSRRNHSHPLHRIFMTPWATIVRTIPLVGMIQAFTGKTLMVTSTRLILVTELDITSSLKDHIGVGQMNLVGIGWMVIPFIQCLYSKDLPFLVTVNHKILRPDLHCWGVEVDCLMIIATLTIENQTVTPHYLFHPGNMLPEFLTRGIVLTRWCHQMNWGYVTTLHRITLLFRLDHVTTMWGPCHRTCRCGLFRVAHQLDQCHMIHQMSLWLMTCRSTRGQATHQWRMLQLTIGHMTCRSTQGQVTHQLDQCHVLQLTIGHMTPRTSQNLMIRGPVNVGPMVDQGLRNLTAALLLSEIKTTPELHPPCPCSQTRAEDLPVVQPSEDPSETSPRPVNQIGLGGCDNVIVVITAARPVVDLVVAAVAGRVLSIEVLAGGTGRGGVVMRETKADRDTAAVMKESLYRLPEGIVLRRTMALPCIHQLQLHHSSVFHWRIPPSAALKSAWVLK